jgi:hypothetical protein
MKSLLQTTFNNEPAAAGWESSGTYPPGGAGFDGEWRPGGAGPRRACLCVRKGLWQSPPLPVTPFRYYRLRFAAQAAQGGAYAFRYWDGQGRLIASDEYNTFEVADGWRTHNVFTQARENAASLRVAFVAPGGEVRVGALEVSEATAGDVLAWSDRLYASLPPVRLASAPGQVRHLDAPIRKLRRGGALRVLVLGDSIANDLGNSQFHLLIQRFYPGSEIVFHRSVRAATGCTYYRRHVRRYVTANAPDLVVIAGISHRCEAGAVRHVVEQTRQQMGRAVAFLVCTGAIMQPGYGRRKAGGAGTLSDEERVRRAFEAERRFYAELESMSRDLRIATLDLRSAWEAYLAGCGRARSWYQRDSIHANARGKQILGRIVAQCFRP